MENATHGMRLPTNYVDMSETDMQFDGGWSWNKFFVGVAIAGAIIGGAGLLTLGAGIVVFSTTAMLAGTIGIGAGLGLGVAGTAGSVATDS